MRFLPKFFVCCLPEHNLTDARSVGGEVGTAVFSAEIRKLKIFAFRAISPTKKEIFIKKFRSRIWRVWRNFCSHGFPRSIFVFEKSSFLNFCGEKRSIFSVKMCFFLHELDLLVFGEFVGHRAYFELLRKSTELVFDDQGNGYRPELGFIFQKLGYKNLNFTF